MSARRRCTAGIGPRKLRGGGVNVLHHAVLVSLCSSAHKLIFDSAVCKYNFPLYYSHCDMCFLFIPFNDLLRNA